MRNFSYIWGYTNIVDNFYSFEIFDVSGRRNLIYILSVQQAKFSRSQLHSNAACILKGHLKKHIFLAAKKAFLNTLLCFPQIHSRIVICYLTPKSHITPFYCLLPSIPIDIPNLNQMQSKTISTQSVCQSSGT